MTHILGQRTSPLICRGCGNGDPDTNGGFVLQDVMELTDGALVPDNLGLCFICAEYVGWHPPTMRDVNRGVPLEAFTAPMGT